MITVNAKYNKFITNVLAPIFKCKFLPFVHVVKLFNLPSEVVTISDKGIEKPGDPIYFTAHRGVTSVAPENTIPAYKEAVRLGYYSAECDIQRTKDGVWVLLHNDTVDKWFCEYGPIKDVTYAEASKYSFKGGSNFWAYDDLRIPTLDEFLDVFVGTNTRPQIEIKAETYDTLHEVVEAVEKKGLVESSIVISFDLQQLREIYKLNDKIELWYLVDRITEENIAEARSISDKV
ncbi:MAG: glycerophosphodiester phosphodiesterase family protein, partial [Acutalibacteraceae bacterium]|nr:glycerophosphodiester phosphodiesterase family protein [Acutalibacteraceae bacterium]